MNNSSLTLQLQSELTQTLSVSHQKSLQKTWNTRIENPFAFIPSKVILSGILREEDAIEANRAFGQFASRFMTKILRDHSTLDILQRRRKVGSLAVGLGCGKGYDLGWSLDAVALDLRPVWLDVSDIACSIAAQELRREFEQIPDNSRLANLRPLVKQGEIRSVLIDPDSVGINFDSVEIWYLSRILGCVSTKSLRIVLKILSQSLGSASYKGIVIVNALRENNKNYTGVVNSKLLSLRSIMNYLRAGVSNDFQIVDMAEYQYFDKIVSAMYIKAN